MDKDKYMKRWMRMSYTPKVLYDMEAGSAGGVSILRGVRQVGKTTMIKVMITKLLKSGIDPLRILYCDSTRMDSIQEAVDYHSNILNDSTTAGRRHLFLDGAASTPMWSERISNILKEVGDADVVISGYMGEIDTINDSNLRMPDVRRIGIIPDNRPTVSKTLNIRNDITMTPMKFSEAAIRINPRIAKIIEDNDTFSVQNRREIMDKITRSQIDPRLEELFSHKSQLNRALDVYMAIGGMPHAIDGYMQRGLSWDPQYQRYLDAMTEAWMAVGRNPDLCNEFGRWLAGYETNLASWDRLSKGTGIMPPQTVLNYANLLERLLLLHLVYRYKNGKPDTNAAKKILFTDPAYLHMYRYSADSGAPPAPLYVPDHRGKVLEGIMGTHLLRLTHMMRPDDDIRQYHSVFYWTDKKSRQVDFVADLGKNRLVPITVKAGKVIRRDMSALTRFLKHTKCNGLLLDQDNMEIHRDYLVMPASVFLILV